MSALRAFFGRAQPASTATLATLRDSSDSSAALSAGPRPAGVAAPGQTDSHPPDPAPEPKNAAPVLAFYEVFVGFGNVSGAPGPPGPANQAANETAAMLLIEAPVDPAEREELYDPGGRGYELCAMVSSIWPRATYFAFGRVFCADRMPAGRAVVIRHADYSAKIE